MMQYTGGYRFVRAVHWNRKLYHLIQHRDGSCLLYVYSEWPRKAENVFGPITIEQAEHLLNEITEKV